MSLGFSDHPSPADRAAVRAMLHQGFAALSPVSQPESAPEFLETVAAAQEVASEARDLLQHSVLSAREAGATWSQIGKTLGISKQAAQKRFAAPQTLPKLRLDPNERLLGPVSMANEITELNLAGRYGWHSVDFGIAHHKVVHSANQWEHCRVASAKKVSELEDQGWAVIGTSFPYTFLKQDTGKPALPEPA